MHRAAPADHSRVRSICIEKVKRSAGWMVTDTSNIASADGAVGTSSSTVATDCVKPAAGRADTTRMDKFVKPLLARTGLLAMIGTAERGPDAVASIKRCGAAWLGATGSAAHLLSKAIRSTRAPDQRTPQAQVPAHACT